MNIEEIKQKKEVLRKAILDMVLDFEKETKTNIVIEHNPVVTYSNIGFEYTHRHTEHKINIKIEI